MYKLDKYSYIKQFNLPRPHAYLFRRERPTSHNHSNRLASSSPFYLLRRSNSQSGTLHPFTLSIFFSTPKLHSQMISSQRFAPLPRASLPSPASSCLPFPSLPCSLLPSLPSPPPLPLALPPLLLLLSFPSPCRLADLTPATHSTHTRNAR